MREDCDRCGAQALVRVIFGDGNELCFCGHHAHELAEQIDQAGGTVFSID